MHYLYIITVLALVASFVADRSKTHKALQIAWKKIRKILPAFVSMLIFVSLVLFFLPDSVISKYLGDESKGVGVLFASLIGSVTLMPGFICFPMCGILLKKGIAYMVLSAFSTTLMMVGVVTYPVEKAYFGTKVTIIRNILSLLIALIVAVVTGICFGEIF